MQGPNNNMNIINNSPIADLNSSNASNYVFYVKILYLIIMAMITSIFGLLPLCFNNCRKDSRLLNYANAFSGGIFLGIGFFHLFPEANENFEKYFATPEGKSSFIFGMPMSYLLAFLSYSLILYLEKVAFNSHSLIAHTHNNLNDDLAEQGLNEPLLDKEKNKNENDEVYHDCTHNLYENDSNIKNSSDEEIGQDEQIIRNIVSSKGQFSSLLQSRNLSK
jgi:zinc transporter ZupT